MTDHPNVRPIDPSDRRFVEDEVEFVELRKSSRAIASGTVATREPSRVSPSRPSGRVSTIARVAETLASPRFLYAYIGFCAGCFATVALALVWSAVL